MTTANGQDEKLQLKAVEMVGYVAGWWLENREETQPDWKQLETYFLVQLTMVKEGELWQRR